MSMNKGTINMVILAGRLTRDPEVVVDSVVKIDVATNRSVKKGDSWESVTDFHNGVTCFGHSAKYAKDYLKKGDMVSIEGSIRMDTWKDKETGKNRNKSYVAVNAIQSIGGKADPAASAPGKAAAPTAAAAVPPAPATAAVEEDYDDLPF